MGGAQRLIARIGLARAKEMVFSGGIYDAKTMLEWGLINQVVPDVDVEVKAHAYAMRLANGPTSAYAASILHDPFYRMEQELIATDIDPSNVSIVLK